MRAMMLKILVLTGTMLAAVHSIAADTVINMPPPKKAKPAQVVVASSGAATVVAPASSPSPDVGVLALSRYGRARSAPTDTYFNGPRYAGIRQYSYPFFHGFPFFGFNCFGPRFVGKIHGHGFCF